MTDLMREISRRQFLKATGAAGAAIGLGGVVAACSTAVNQATATAGPSSAASGAPAASAAAASVAPTGTFNWMTWGDHWYQAQMDVIASTNNIKASSTLFSDNIDAYTKL
jgi:hypothetical protein